MKKEILLNGEALRIEDVSKVAKENFKVRVSDEAKERIEDVREYVLSKLDSDEPVYGMNRGVGENKDKVVFEDYYEEYNNNLIKSHCVAIKPEATEEEVRAVILARLNTLLVGRAGIQPAIVDMYCDFLNKQIHPIMPKRGSVGMGDITCLSHIGLAMIGEGEVIYQGKRMKAQQALDEAGLEAITLGPKDGLAIVSSNALGAGQAALALDEIDRLIKIADLIYALSLEGLKGNVTPLEELTYKFRPYEGQAISAERIREYLEGSYLWQPSIVRPLQDALSYRTASQNHGAVIDALNYAKKQLKVQLNSSDDSPCVLPEEDKMISCGNFEPLTWVLALEMVAIGLNHLSKISCLRTEKLAAPKFTGLSRFLTPADGQVIAYGTIQKPFASLNSEIRHLANPSSIDYQSLAGHIEDHSTNSSHVVERLFKIIDNIYYILGIEAMHSAQAIDLRGVSNTLGEGTKQLYKLFREEIPFLEKDRVLTKDIEKAYQLLKRGSFL
ncbi:aromatic amino acid ammonia-lyase [Natroniella acetigena]|uniref:HAL/PAL/TAL family ammonia-lyase n=1 Tax=Natroniella acetigena TaxID=52004 RepID=UPI00200B02A7|nr:aromatic amino acid ammonia-lyase [Natroniella acetigena]MCK8827298.1 aromatic amino acid ammonia-lyase [Natroniella acetigena]